jgi:integrase
MAAVKITKRTVDAAAPGEREYAIWDSEISGFGLRVYPTGRKAYCLRYRVGGGRGGTARKPTIGTHGTITAEQARAIAKDWSAEIRRGGDPSATRTASRNAPLMADLFERYLEDHARPHKKASSVKDDEGLIRCLLLPAFRRRKVAEVTRADVDGFHKGLKGTPYRANRALALLSKSFNLAEVWGWRPDGSNPCRHVRKYREEKRERFLSQQELARLGSALAAAERGEVTSPRGVTISPYAVAATRLLIFTGARRGEILGLRWEHVNFEAGRLELPDSKTGAKFIYLPPAALQLLQELPRVEGNPHVIVGGKPGAALVNLREPWVAIRQAADLGDLRIHDLRHSFASVGAAGGMSLPIIGALLGHKETATTARYAHLSDDPLRSAANTIGSKIADALDADAV